MFNDYNGIGVDYINETVGSCWQDVDYSARTMDDIIIDTQVQPIVGESIDGCCDVIGFTFY